MKTKFEMGQIVVTCGIQEKYMDEGSTKHRQFVPGVLIRHSQGDWGLLEPEDRESNEESLRDGGQLMSVYKDDDGEKVWVITDRDGDKSITTVLLPEEY